MTQHDMRNVRALKLAAMAATVALPAFADANDAAGLLGCTACGGILILIPLMIVALNIAMLVWVAKDSKARGMDTPILWMLMVFFLSVVGLIIYIFARPQGEIIQCPHCSNNRLRTLSQCPHCGRA
jgi:hypothetical protein